MPEKVLNLVGLTNQDVGRSFALIAGVDTYPILTGSDQSLEPASADISNMVRYLREIEFFDEIVVLQNEAVTDENFKFFLQAYFPAQLRAFPKSRFLFAYSGHGFTDGTRGYLVQARARTLDDKANSISMRLLRVLYDEIVDSAHQSLALINACYSGDFHPRTFGVERRLVPREAGHHVITAGAADEVAWHDDRVGPGSVFFEKVFAGLDGRADQYPQQPDGSVGDGVVTVEELDAYLRYEVKFATREEQNPIRSDLSHHGSKGSFFFLNRYRQFQAGNVPEFDTTRATTMGEGVTQAGGPTKLAPKEVQAPANSQRGVGRETPPNQATAPEVSGRQPSNPPRPDYGGQDEEMCIVQIIVEPEDASIYLDGDFMGTGTDVAPPKGLSISKGALHELELVRPGFRSKRLSVDSKQCSKAPMSFALEEQEADTSRPLPQKSGTTPPPPPPSFAQVVDQMGFRFSLMGCFRSGPSLRCEFLVTNREEDRELDLDGGRLVESGYEHSAVAVGFGGRVGYLQRRARLATDVGTWAQIKFENVGRDVRQVALLEIELGPPGRAESRRYGVFGVPRVQFRSIEVHEE